MTSGEKLCLLVKLSRTDIKRESLHKNHVGECLSWRKRAERKRARRCDGQNNEENTRCK